MHLCSRPLCLPLTHAHTRAHTQLSICHKHTKLTLAEFINELIKRAAVLNSGR